MYVLVYVYINVCMEQTITEASIVASRKVEPLLSIFFSEDRNFASDSACFLLFILRSGTTTSGVTPLLSSAVSLSASSPSSVSMRSSGVAK